MANNEEIFLPTSEDPTEKNVPEATVENHVENIIDVIN